MGARRGGHLGWSYGLQWHKMDGIELMLITDSGNNRVVIWERA